VQAGFVPGNGIWYAVDHQRRSLNICGWPRAPGLGRISNTHACVSFEAFPRIDLSKRITRAAGVAAIRRSTGLGVGCAA
jgi:hypothetical protein